MDKQKQDDQLELIYTISVQIQDVAWKTSRERWMIEMGDERGSGRPVLAVQQDDDTIRCYHSGPEWTWEQWQ